MSQIKLEILEANYWEHFKMAKDYSQIFPLGHPKRIYIEEGMNKLIKEIHELKRKMNNQ